MIKVSGLIYKRLKQSDYRISCLVFQKIYLMHRIIKKKEGTNANFLLMSMSENIKLNKQNDKVEDLWDKA